MAKIVSETTQRRPVDWRQREIVKNGLTRGHLKTLNKDLILKKQQRDDPDAARGLQEVVRIDLNYNSVQILHQQSLIQCCRLVICNLRGCYVTSLKPFQACSNLLKLDVADNQIATLPRGGFWQYLRVLKVLYLNGNALYSLQDLASLQSSPSLVILTLADTPLALDQNYRHHVVNSIHSLKAVDSFVISDEEIIGNLRLPSKFGALGDNMKFQVYTPTLPGTSVRDEIRQVFSLLLTVDRIMAKYSPVTIIQRYIRGWLVRLRLARDSNLYVRKLVKKYMPQRAVLIRRAIHAPPSTPFSQQVQQKQVSFTLQSTPHAARRYSDVHPTGSLAKTRLPAITQERDITASARALMLRAYPSHAFSTETFSTTSNLRRKIMSVTNLGDAEGVWMEGPSPRRRKKSDRKLERKRSSERRQVKEKTEQRHVPIEIHTGLSNDDEQEDSERAPSVQNNAEYLQEDMEIKHEDNANEDVIVQGIPPHTLKEGAGDKELPQVLAKQHKELKDAAKAARNKSKEEIHYKEDNKLDSSRKLMAVKHPFSLRAIKMVDKYHTQMQNLQKQEEKSCHVALQYLERAARQESVKEAMIKRRQKLAEWAGDHWDLVACRAEEVEEELHTLQDQVAILRHRHQLQLQKEKANIEATVQALQNFTLLDNSIKKMKVADRRKASLASVQEEVCERQKDWEAEKEEHKLLEMKTHAKLVAKSKQDKRNLRKQHAQNIASRNMDNRTKVLEGKEKCEMSSRLTEKSKEEMLTEKLRDIPKTFILQSDNVPSMKFGVTPVPRIPRHLQRSLMKKVTFLTDSESDGLVASGTKSLPIQNVFVSLPKKYSNSPPETPFTELNSTPSI